MFGRILVAGHTGYTGSWVVNALRQAFPGAEIIGLARRTGGGEPGGIPDEEIACDLAQRDAVAAAVKSARPDALVHLASLRNAGLSALLETNVLGLEYLLDGIASAVPDARVLVVGSAAEIGRPPRGAQAVSETMVCQPVDAYGVSKLAQSALAQARALRGQNVIRLRPFNLIGPRMPDGLLPGRCARLLREASLQREPTVLQFGPLETRRDYLDVRDFARAVALGLVHGISGSLYHVGSGQSRKGHEVVQALIEKAGMQGVRYQASQSGGMDLVPAQAADSSKAKQVLGWSPQISWEQSVNDLWQSMLWINRAKGRPE